MKTWSALPLRLRLYITAVVLLATPLLLVAINNVLNGHYGFTWLLITAITLVTVPIFISLPSVSTAVGIGDAFVDNQLFGDADAVSVKV